MCILLQSWPTLYDSESIIRLLHKITANIRGYHNSKHGQTYKDHNLLLQISHEGKRKIHLIRYDNYIEIFISFFKINLDKCTY